MDVSTAVFAVSCAGTPITGTRALQKERQLNQFLAEVERRALRIAEIGCGIATKRSTWCRMR